MECTKIHAYIKAICNRAYWVTRFITPMSKHWLSINKIPLATSVFMLSFWLQLRINTWNWAKKVRCQFGIFFPHVILDPWIKLILVWSLQWHHNERNGVSNHQPHNCLLNCLFRHRSKKTSKLHVTGLCATGEFPAQRPVMRKMFPFDDVIM